MCFIYLAAAYGLFRGHRPLSGRECNCRNYDKTALEKSALKKFNNSRVMSIAHAAGGIPASLCFSLFCLVCDLRFPPSFKRSSTVQSVQHFLFAHQRRVQFDDIAAIVVELASKRLPNRSAFLV